MTEVPEHLLARSRAARAKAGGGDAGGGEPPATPGEAPGTGAKATAVEPAGGSEVATPAAAAVPAEPAKPVPPYVAAAQARRRVPKFAIPALAALPLWALIYAGTLTETGPEDPELALGASVYSAQCSGCHGGGGGGGVGRPLGDVLEVFPDRQAHIDWVVNGSPEPGTPYGDPAVGRISQSDGYGAMPGFEGTLSPEEIAAVVRYERETFGGEAPTPTGAEGAEGDSADGSGEEAGEQEVGGEGEAADPSNTDADAEAEGQGGNIGGEGGGGNEQDAAPTDEGGQTEGNPSGGGGTGADDGGQPTE